MVEAGSMQFLNLTQHLPLQGQRRNELVVMLPLADKIWSRHGVSEIFV